MRTKALLGLAALAVGLSTSVAQNVYSLNVVGYVNVTLTNNQFSLMSLPLKPSPNYTIGSSLIMDNGDGSANFSQIYIYSGGTWVTPTWLGGWDDPSQVITNGQGFWMYPNLATPTATVTFVGEVQQGTIPYTAPVGFSLMGPQIPISTNWPGSTIPANFFDTLYQYVGGTWDTWTYLGTWTGSLPGEDAMPEGPMLNPAVGLWYFNNGTDPVNWSQNFTVQ